MLRPGRLKIIYNLYQHLAFIACRNHYERNNAYITQVRVGKVVGRDLYGNVERKRNMAIAFENFEFRYIASVCSIVSFSSSFSSLQSLKMSVCEIPRLNGNLLKCPMSSHYSCNHFQLVFVKLKYSPKTIAKINSKITILSLFTPILDEFSKNKRDKSYTLHQTLITTYTKLNR